MRSELRRDRLFQTDQNQRSALWNSVGATLLVSLGAGLSVANALMMTTGGSLV